jgi:DNA polymerase-1
MFDRYDDEGNVVSYGHADDQDRIHPRWNVHRITGRWSAEDPQSQNWPKADKKKGRPNLRSQVVAPEGRMIVGFDFAQLEARIIALLSGDPFLCDIFHTGKDIHSEFARIVFPDFDDQPYDRRKILRDTVKRPEYGAFYGGQVETLWNNIKKDYPDVQLADIARMVSLMTARMPGVTMWHQQLLRDVAQPPHEIRSAIYGRRRCFPLGNADINDVYNFPVQSTGADIMAAGLLALMPKLRRNYRRAEPIIQIHDAIVFECDEDESDRLQADVKECFEQTHTHNGVTIHFPVDPAAGKSWADV